MQKFPLMRSKFVLLFTTYISRVPDPKVGAEELTKSLLPLCALEPLPSPTHLFQVSTESLRNRSSSHTKFGLSLDDHRRRIKHQRRTPLPSLIYTGRLAMSAVLVNFAESAEVSFTFHFFRPSNVSQSSHSPFPTIFAPSFSPPLS